MYSIHTKGWKRSYRLIDLSRIDSRSICRGSCSFLHVASSIKDAGRRFCSGEKFLQHIDCGTAILFGVHRFFYYAFIAFAEPGL